MATRLHTTTATLEAEAGRLERVAKGLNCWAAVAFAAAPATPPKTLPLPSAETWPVIDGGLVDAPKLATTAAPIAGTGAPDAA